MFTAGEPGLQLPHHGPQSGSATAAHVHSQVGQEEQGAQVCYQVHEIPSVPFLPHCLPVTLLKECSAEFPVLLISHPVLQ